jgi:hypothetical protein
VAAQKSGQHKRGNHRFYAPLRVPSGAVRLVKITAKEVGVGQQPELGDRLYAIETIEVIPHPWWLPQQRRLQTST